MNKLPSTLPPPPVPPKRIPPRAPTIPETPSSKQQGPGIVAANKPEPPQSTALVSTPQR